MSSKIANKITNYKNIIWDWNGTLLDDLWAAVEAENKQIEKYQLPKIGLEKRRQSFHLPIKSYYESLGFNFDQICFESVAAEWMATYDSLKNQITLFKETPELLEELKNTNKRQFILSAAPEAHLLEITEELKIKHYFEKIYGLPDHYARSKVERGLELLQENKINKAETIMIGDTDHDAEVAQAMGIEILLVGDGHQCPSILLKHSENVLETRF